MACISGFVFVGEGDRRFVAIWRALLLSVSRRKGDTETRGGYGCSLTNVASSADIVSGFKLIDEVVFKGCGITLESG
jgi:hypothetical protein